MSKRAKPVKKRKRTDCKLQAKGWMNWFYDKKEQLENSERETEEAVTHVLEAEGELTRYRLICDWACQRIEKLEAEICKQQREKRILLDTLFDVQADNIMQGEDILKQRDELIKLRGEPAERISL